MQKWPNCLQYSAKVCGPLEYLKMCAVGFTFAETVVWVETIKTVPHGRTGTFHMHRLTFLEVGSSDWLALTEPQ